MKTRGGEALYAHVEQRGEALGPDSAPFLNVLVISDRIGRYRTISGEPKTPHVWIKAESDAMMVLHCSFSGKNYPLEHEAIAWMMARGRRAGGTLVVSGTLKGTIWGSPWRVPPENTAGRADGTLLAFQWPRANGALGVKAFVLN